MKISTSRYLYYLLALTILLSPTYIVRHTICCLPFIGEYPTTLLEILVFLTFGFYSVEKLKKNNFDFLNLSRKFLFSIGLFLIAALLSVLISPDRMGALGILKAYFILPIVIFFILLDLTRDTRDLNFFLSALLLSGLWISLLAIFQGLTGFFVFAPHEMLQGRAHAVYNTANAVGLFVGPIFALSFGLFLEALLSKLKTQTSQPEADQPLVENHKTASQNLKLLAYSILSIFYVAAILFTKSRGALIGISVVILVLVISFFVSLYPYIFISKLMRRLGPRILALCLGLGFLAGVWFFLNISQFTPQVENIYERTGGSELVRLCLWEGTRNLLMDKPFLGAGLSGFKEVYSTRYLTCDAEALEYPHNIILNFWTETGLLGVVSFSLILFFYFSNLKTKKSHLKTAFAAAMLYWLLHGFVDVPYFKNDLSLEFWTIVALSRVIP